MIYTKNMTIYVCDNCDVRVARQDNEDSPDGWLFKGEDLGGGCVLVEDLCPDCIADYMEASK